jgi:hypothetical protein
MMRRQSSVRKQETQAVKERPGKHPVVADAVGEAMSMLVRRGFHPVSTPPDLPFPPALSEESAGQLSALLASYAFRLFLRGAILKPDGVSPGETTRYLKAHQAKKYAGTLVELRLARRLAGERYQLLHPARSFGGVLEWFIARELRRRYAFDVITGVKLRVSGVGGDFDVVAAAEGKLVYLELKSSPPKNLMVAEVGAFFDRLRVLRPDLALFVPAAKADPSKNVENVDTHQ